MLLVCNAQGGRARRLCRQELVTSAVSLAVVSLHWHWPVGFSDDLGALHFRHWQCVAVCGGHGNIPMNN